MKKAISGEARGHDIHDGKERKLVKLQSAQLSLFQTFLPRDEKYSNTIELYDAIPKFSTKRLMSKARIGPEGQEVFLPTLEREFRYKDTTYILKMKPARITNKKKEKKEEIEYYPSEREELVEEALRKLACDPLNGAYIGALAGVQFTMYELREELRKRGHSISLNDLKKSLLICRGAGLHVTKSGEDDPLLESSIFPTVMISNRKSWRADPKGSRCFVQFNPLVTASIEALTFRQFDYETLMSYRMQLSRWLHKRLYHNYINAGLMQPYHFLLSSIKRDSGLLNNERISQDIKYLEQSLEELEEKKIIWGFDKEVRRIGRNNQIDDVLYTLKASMDFIKEMKAANAHHADIQKKLPLMLTHQK
ncbi:MAG: hypothetical protein M3297_08985 [Thermoproteota archaeon]|jgi:hypothetical protein|nr:hypothetical protein [Thermoproteota archaeon]